MKKILLLILILIPFSLLSQDIENKVKWYESDELDKAIQMSKVNSKPVFINIYTKWCEYSYKMNNYTLMNDTIINLLNDRFNYVLFDAEFRKPITYNGEKYINLDPYGPRSAHLLTNELLDGNLSYPTYLLILDSEVMYITSGYVETWDMIDILIYISDDIYKIKTWKEYSKELENKRDSLLKVKIENENI